MVILSPAPLPLLAAVILATSVMPGALREARGQVPRGSLERLGGPATLLRRPFSSVRDTASQWLDHRWSLRLTAVADTITRVTAETFHSDIAGADSLSRALSGLLAYELGEPLQEDCTTFRWSASDGEVVYRFIEDARGRRVTVVLTSRVAR